MISMLGADCSYPVYERQRGHDDGVKSKGGKSGRKSDGDKSKSPCAV